MFAEDINVLISDGDKRLLQTKIDRVVAELETWFNRNNLVINAGKTAVMLWSVKKEYQQDATNIDDLLSIPDVIIDYCLDMFRA